MKCFLLVPVEPHLERRSLRRYGGDQCPGEFGYHNAHFPLGDFTEKADDVRDKPAADDPRWPAACGCGYVFKDDDARQLFHQHLFRRSDTDELVTLREAPAGAMWFAPWLSNCKEWKGPDGRTLVVRCPDGHDWIVDSRASNCTLPNDSEHKCWVRHGEPPNVTVDKNGLTCSAGAGSIQTPKWHGFLRNGELVE